MFACVSTDIAHIRLYLVKQLYVFVSCGTLSADIFTFTLLKYKWFGEKKATYIYVEPNNNLDINGYRAHITYSGRHGSVWLHITNNVMRHIASLGVWYSVVWKSFFLIYIHHSNPHSNIFYAKYRILCVYVRFLCMFMQIVSDLACLYAVCYTPSSL